MQTQSALDQELVHPLLFLQLSEKKSIDRSFAAFFRQFQAVVQERINSVAKRYRSRLCRAELDEVLSELWMSLVANDYKKLRAYRAERGSIASFLSVLAAHATVDWLRARRPRVSLDEIGFEPMIDAVDPFAAAEALEREELAERALASLSPGERSFVVDYLTGTIDADAHARVRGLSRSTVYTRKFRIQQKLVRIFRELSPVALAA